jgi:hypothetical protein
MLSIAFYKELMNKMSIGQALRNARKQAIETVGINNVIWASYMLYGDPASKLFDETKRDKEEGDIMAQSKGKKHSGVKASEDKLRSSAPEPANQKKKTAKGLLWGIITICFLAAIVFAIKWKSPSPQNQNISQAKVQPKFSHKR